MRFSDIHPFVRYAHSLHVNEKSVFGEVVALDARLFFVQSGYGSLSVNGKNYNLKKDDLCIINSGIPYQIQKTAGETTYLQINFDYDQKAADFCAPILPVKKEAFSKDLLPNHAIITDSDYPKDVLYLENMGILQKRLHSIISEFSLRLAFFKEKMSNLLFSCIIDAARAHQSSLSTMDGTICTEVIQYVHENYMHTLTNASIGAFFGYHPNYISQLIKSATGLPLHKYLIHVRLMKAVSLLQNTHLGVSEIALSCGFCDLAHFSGYFKRTFRTNPSKFRNV